jgi:hypothetical protein
LPIAAEAAIREWVNDPANGLVAADGDDSAPISRGAYLAAQRSPADGAYLVISRALPGGSEAPVAETLTEMGTARIIAQAFAGTPEAAESAATAYAKKVAELTGRPQRVGGSDVWLLSHDSLSGPAFIAAGPTTGERFCFQVVAEFLIADYGTP